MSSDKIYWALKPSKDKANVLLGKATAWHESLYSIGYTQKLMDMWAAYHGAFYANFGDAHSIQFSGDQGELTSIGINHIRNLHEHMLNMITAVRPAVEARAVNTDPKSLIQADLANGLLDYYMREKRLETYLETAVVYALLWGSGYVKMEWNSKAGEFVEIDDEGPVTTQIKTGDIEYSNLTPFDVIFDTAREDNNPDWILCRSWKNRYDLIAKYPDLENKILNLPAKDEYTTFDVTTWGGDSTDLVAIYEFYHKRSEAVEDGSYMFFCDDETVFYDGPLPYRDIPVYRVSPQNVVGTPFGYTPLFDVLSPQDAINSLYSTILSNQSAAGLLNILVPRGADIEFNEVGNGLNVIEYNDASKGGGDPKPLQILNTSPEIFNFLEKLESTIETLTGINSVTRGDPQASLRSGNALALVQSMAVQFISRLQRAYVQLIEDTGLGTINILKDYASAPRVASIAGLNNKSYVKEFTGEDLSQINRVIVDVANPLARTTAGRIEIANNLLQIPGAIKNANDYFTVLKTGNLDTLTDDATRQALTSKMENEWLINGREVVAIQTDDHSTHILEHANALSDPELRFDLALVKRVMDHIYEHVNLLKTTDPALLALLHQQPIPQMPPPQQGPPSPGIPNPDLGNTTPEQIGQMIPKVPEAANGLPTNSADNLPV